MFLSLHSKHMRIAFVGKGGSGKTTTASLFAAHMHAKGKRVLTLDADINQHMAASLGFTGKLPSMGMEFDLIKQHLKGRNERFSVEEMKKTTPPGSGSKFVTLDHDDWFMQTYTREANGIQTAGAGEIPEGNVGVKCYHGLNGAVELVLGHMIDGKNDVVIVDMTAGADAFSSTLFAKVDALVLVVEPTVKSLSVYEQFLPNVKKYNLPLFVVGNKIIDDIDRVFIAKTVPVLAAEIPQSGAVRAKERGQVATLEPEVQNALDQLAETLQKEVVRDWDRLERLSHELHIKNADSWAGEAAKQQIDPNFSLRDVL